jgi:DNA-binding response OmpR family regulator
MIKRYHLICVASATVFEAQWKSAFAGGRPIRGRLYRRGRRTGYAIDPAADGAGLSPGLTNPLRLVILDVILPVKDSHTVQLRSPGFAPILMLTPAFHRRRVAGLYGATTA